MQTADSNTTRPAPDDDTRQIVHVVDDEPQIQALFAQIARSHALDLVTYATATAFLEAFDVEQSGCIVLDLNLPDRSGLEILTALAERGCRTPVVFMSGLARVSEAVRALKLGSLDFIEKPFQIADMVEAIQGALRTDREQRRHAAREGQIRSRFGSLTQREREVMQLVVEGLPNKVIATRLGVSPKTVEVHRAHVMQKTGADSLAELVKMAVACGYTGATARTS